MNKPMGFKAARIQLWRIMWFSALSTIVFVTGRAQQTGGFTTIVIVRHAEKDSTGVNPGLTERGMERAQSLARVLNGLDITAIYVTQYLRTLQTAQPAARLHRVTPTAIDVDLSNPQRYARLLADTILQRNKGQTILVSNHSNIIPFLIEALGANNPGTIDDRTYDNLFIVIRDSSGAAKGFRLTYGSPSD
ncbi:MAG TPA: phosphoglycerate mutase family protein [Bacteroidota bacterium]